MGRQTNRNGLRYLLPTDKKDKQTDRQPIKTPDMQTDGQTDRQTDRQTASHLNGPEVRAAETNKSWCPSSQGCKGMSKKNFFFPPDPLISRSPPTPLELLRTMIYSRIFVLLFRKPAKKHFFTPSLSCIQTGCTTINLMYYPFIPLLA